MTTVSRRTLLQAAAGAPVAPATNASCRYNLIHIGVDTWGADWTGCYGAKQVRTPSVDRLAAKCAVFSQMYAEVLPTIPCRRSIYTGRRIFPSDLVLQRDDQVKIRGWHPMFAEDVTLSETLQTAGYTTAIVSDVYHQFKPDKNFHRGFDSWRWIRGQESDRLESGPRRAIDLKRYLHASQRAQLEMKKGGVLQYLLNRRDWRNEDDWLAAQVFREGERWLENNVEDNQPFYLHLESFSPHEFWDPPEDYYRMYMKSDYRGPRLIQPPLFTKGMSATEVDHVRALYAGLVSFVDSRIGRFLRKVEALGLMRDSVIVFVADHGTMMGEQGQLHKAETRLRRQVTKVPFLVYHPKGSWEGRRIDGFVQHTDLAPTVLDLLGVERPARMTGRSLVKLIESRQSSPLERIVTGWGEHASVRTKEWNYIARWSAGPEFEELYNLGSDPEELTNVAAKQAAVAQDFRRALREHIESGWKITRGSFARVLT